MRRLVFVLFSVITLAARSAPATSPPPDPAPLQFCGIMSVQGQLAFRMLDPTSHLSWWMSMGETRGGVVIRQYDADATTLAVSYAGQIQLLRLRPARVVSADEAGVDAAAAQYREKMYAEMARHRAERQAWLQAAATRRGE